MLPYIVLLLLTLVLSTVQSLPGGEQPIGNDLQIKSEYINKCLRDKHLDYHNLVWDWGLSTRARKQMDKLNEESDDFVVDGIILLKQIRQGVVVRYFCEEYMHFARSPILKNRPGTILPNDGNAVGCASKITWDNEGRIFCMYKFVYPDPAELT